MMRNFKILPFDGNYTELAALIKRSWPLEHRTHIDFTRSYLKYLLESPDIDPHLTLGGYIGNQLVCFCFSKEKQIHIGKKRYRALFNSLATTDPDFSHMFPYLKLNEHMLTGAENRGYDLYYGYTAYGIKNNEIADLFARRKGYLFHHISTFNMLLADIEQISPLRHSGDGIEILPFNPDNPGETAQCMTLIFRHTRQCAVCEALSENVFVYRFSDSPYSRTKIIKKGGEIKGLINFSILDFTGIRPKKTAIFYNWFVHMFSASEKKKILASIIPELKENGVSGISIPNTGYFNTGDLLEMGFVDYPFKQGKTSLSIVTFTDEIHLNRNTFWLEIT